jgi:hypothetical protein
MEDIFISYASEDREQARRFAEAFAARGWSVWWDRHIVPRELSTRALSRHWTRRVRGGAVVGLVGGLGVGEERGCCGCGAGGLVPAMIEPVKLPLEFRRKQTADLCAGRRSGATRVRVSVQWDSAGAW